MRFLILTQYFPPEIGGAQTRLKSFAAELLRQGHQVEVVTAKPNYPQGRFFPGYEKGFYRRELLDGILVHRVWTYPAIGSGVKRLINYVSFAVASFYGLWKAKRPDYIFVESPPLFLSVTAFLAGLLWCVPLIFNVADLWPDVIIDGGFLKEGLVARCLRSLESWSYRRASHVTAVTEWILEILREKKSVPDGKLLFLPNGVDTRHFYPRTPDEPLKRELGLDRKQIVLWAGTLGYAHGLDNVLQAAKLLEPETDVHFLFVGDGSARDGLRRLRDQLQLTNLTFHDPVSLDRIAAYYSIAFCGLASLIDIPTYDGARPSKLFPILASGRPLLFAGKGEAARLVERSRGGLVVAPGNPQSIADAILRLARNPELCEELGQNGRQFVVENLQWSAVVGNWLDQLSRGQVKNQSRAATAVAAPE